jgi:hypothetical protein
MAGNGLRFSRAETPVRLAWLRSQGLGVLCCQAAVVLFAVGSVVLATTRDGVSADIAMDEIRGFFTKPSFAHTWFYLLLPVLALFALNTLLCTWDTVVARVKAGRREPSAYAAALVHVGILVALLSHLVGGLWSYEGGQVLVGSDWTALGDGRVARLVDLTIAPQADGSPKSVRAALELRSPSGETSTEVVGFNEPLSAGFGSDLTLLMRPIAVPGGYSDVGGEAVLLRHRVAPGNPLGLVAALLMALGIACMWRRVA